MIEAGRWVEGLVMRMGLAWVAGQIERRDGSIGIYLLFGSG